MYIYTQHVEAAVKSKSIKRLQAMAATATTPTTAAAAHRIPYLQLHLPVVDVDHSRPELYANCEVVNRLKTLVGELQKQT